MRKVMEKWTSFIIITAFVITTLNCPMKQIISKADEKNNNYGVNNPTMDENGVTTWNCVCFGNYPQSKYTPKKEPENPVSGKEYTDSDGSRMVYEEWECKEYDKEDDEYKKVKHQGYFKVEPIKWRVLSVDGEDALLMADSSLDVRCFNETYWVDKNKNEKVEEDEIVTWKDSSLRSWLNDEFYQKAFSDEEKKSVLESTNTNEGTDSKEETYNNRFSFPDGGTTQDKVFIPSRTEMKNADYGMPDNKIGNVNRGSNCTDYAKTKLNYESESTYWWLRSPQAYFVDSGDFDYAIMMDWDEYPTVDDNWGIRPAIHLNLSNESYEKTDKLTIEAYKKKVEYLIDGVPVLLSCMSDGSVWLKIGEEKEKVVDRADYGVKEAGLSRDGVYCYINHEEQAYYGKNYEYEGEYHAIDYLKGLRGGSPWYYRTESGDIVDSYDEAVENGEAAVRFIYDEDNYVTGYETTKGKIVKWTSYQEMEALSAQDDDEPDTPPSLPPTATPNPDKGSSNTQNTVPSGQITSKPKVSTGKKVQMLSKIILKSAKNVKGKKLFVKWKKDKNAKGYQISYSTNKKFKKNMKIKDITKTTFTVKKLKKKKTYYVRVRAYTLSNGKKVYGKWSSVKKVKIKK